MENASAREDITYGQTTSLNKYVHACLCPKMYDTDE